MVLLLEWAKFIIDFLLESNSGLSSRREESPDEEDENDIGIDWVEIEEEIILEQENFENIDNNNSIIDEQICEAPEASDQTVESSRKRPANTSMAGVDFYNL